MPASSCCALQPRQNLGLSSTGLLRNTATLRPAAKLCTRCCSIELCMMASLEQQPPAQL